MAGRTIAIGDIHGCSVALDKLLAAIHPTADDTLIPLGDFIDRGPDSRGVVQRLLDLQSKCTLIPIFGNHEEMLMQAGVGGESETKFWLNCGGLATIESYGGGLDSMPMEHIRLISQCRRWHETDTHLFLHANYLPHLPLDKQPPGHLRWISLFEYQPEAHQSGKTAVVGHTTQRNGEILDLGYLKCIDTFCHGGGWLTALEVNSGDVWQANQLGELRTT